MKFLPRARRRFALSARLEPGHGIAGIGVLALALLVGCGAGGKDGGGVVTTGGSGGAPPVGGNSGSGAGDPILGDCIGAACELSEDDLDVIAPPGCGDGVLTDDEACDDGNRNSDDGCASHCLATDPGYSCAAPGQPCRQIARCGDGVVAATEQCDDQNVAPGDGCSARCKVELGKKCEGQPSVCTDAVCGNMVQEGAEACDDGNTIPFDGCSPLCLREPICEGASCTSECGDGLLLNEECDDGNTVDGDGCSSTCVPETGFRCIAEAACETDVTTGGCILRVPAIFRDFGDAHQDFGEDKACTSLAPNAVQANLNAQRRPVMNPATAAAACLSTPDNFNQWYTSIPGVNQTLVGEIVLYDNTEEGYVNRFGPNGEQFLGVDTDVEQRGYAATLAGCQQVCANEAANQTQCFNECNPFQQTVQQTQNNLNQRTNELNQAIAQNNAAQVALLQPQVDQLTLDLATAQAGLATCQTNCQAETTELTNACSATCGPCINNPAQFCSGGAPVYFDGNPLFFPVDSITGPTSSLAQARVPDQYGWNGFPFENALFPGRPAASYNHNFYFTSEVQYWFKYEADTVATLEFLGDDDVWVFLNGRLAVDLGGIHVPSRGSVTINAPANTVNATSQDLRGFPNPTAAAIPRPGTPATYGLEPGNVYMITVFQAERKRDGSSFQLTLSGFEATPSECTAICDDGILSFGEECDDGVNDGGYGECNPGCVLGPFCGDGIQQAEFGESCDVGPLGDPTCRGCRRLMIQ